MPRVSRPAPYVGDAFNKRKQQNIEAYDRLVQTSPRVSLNLLVDFFSGRSECDTPVEETKLLKARSFHGSNVTQCSRLAFAECTGAEFNAPMNHRGEHYREEF